MTDQPIPPVSLFRLFTRMGGWIVLVLGVFLLLFTLISHLSLQQAKRFEAEGQAAEATVTDKYTTTSRDADGDTSTSYWLVFNYRTSDRQEIEKTTTVGTNLYRSVEVGGTFELLYLASDPEKVETNPGSNRSMSRVTQGMALVFGLIWLAGFWIVGRWAVAGARARTYGSRHRVKVTELRRTNLRVNNRPCYRLIWEEPGGGEGRSLLQRSATVKGLKPGDEIDIYEGLKSGWWVGDVGVREG
jgi:hypothetical protein